MADTRAASDSTLGGAKHFGEYLVENGVIDEGHRDDALAIQNAINFKLGILANHDQILTVAQVYTVLEQQRLSGKPFGQVARSLDLIDKEHLNRLLDRQNELRMRVGEILIGLGYLTFEQMEEALENFCAEYYDCN